MPIYHQVGHDSINLIFEDFLSHFNGAILSPVNYTQVKLTSEIRKIRNTHDKFELIFDPQLYCPRTTREKLLTWSYFPQDVDTVDLSDIDWWKTLIAALSNTLVELGLSCVCSPATFPRTFNTDYYNLMNQVTCELCERVDGKGISVLQTSLISLSNLSDFNAVMEIASILTRTTARGIYLLLHSDLKPRRELFQTEEIKGAMHLIKTLHKNELEVLVGCSSSDLLLWKTSGANSCASGKYFNLRRFTLSRFEDEESSGGGQLPYLFEENLLAFLRESDLIRVERANLLSEATLANPFYKQIQANIQTGQPWLGLSWRFYLYWIAVIERKLDQNEITAEQLIRNADANWLKIEDKKVILEERRNTGAWIREWLRAILEYEKPW